MSNIKTNYTEAITGYCDRYVAESFKKDFINILGRENLLETRGEVYPDEFIPLLEQSKLINDVGMWVLETALNASISLDSP